MWLFISSNENESASGLNIRTDFEQKFAISERYKCETLDNKVCVCSSGVQGFKFRDALENDVEIRELWSIEWRGVLRANLGANPLCFTLF